ncbi:hypothetical protein D3C85_1820980 [compost metagenome]
MRYVTSGRYRVLFDAAKGAATWVRTDQAWGRFCVVAKVNRDDSSGAIAYATGAEFFAVGL